MTSVDCLIYFFDKITGQALQILKSDFKVLKDVQIEHFQRFKAQ